MQSRAYDSLRWSCIVERKESKKPHVFHLDCVRRYWEMAYNIGMGFSAAHTKNRR